MTSEVKTDIFGCRYHKEYTAYPFKLTNGGVEHNFLVVDLMPSLSSKFLCDACVWVCGCVRERGRIK